MTAPMSTGEVGARCGCRHETVVGWITHGVLLHGRRVKLAAFRAGQRWKVTVEALEAFQAACRGESRPVQPVSPAKASREALAAQDRVRNRLQGAKR